MKIVCKAPYDLPLSWRFVASFGGRDAQSEPALSMWWSEKPTLVRFDQAARKPPTIAVRARPAPARPARFADLMRQVLNADLALEPFYKKARPDPVMGPVVGKLRGLKPLRPPDIFQMMVIAVTEQQLSLASARSIRERMVDRFGTRVDGFPVFPRPGDLAAAGIEGLKRCGLSGRKAEYILNLARMFEAGDLNPQEWLRIPDDELISLIRSYRGFGEWSAEYILVRGLGRTDVIPAADVGLRSLVGLYFGDGRRLSADEVRRTLEGWAPYRGLVAFYIMADYRLNQMGLDQAQ